MFLQKADLKICSKFTGEQLCQSVISIKLQSKSKTDNRVQKGCSYKHLANVCQKNSYLPRVHTAKSKIKITAN